MDNFLFSPFLFLLWFSVRNIECRHVCRHRLSFFLLQIPTFLTFSSDEKERRKRSSCCEVRGKRKNFSLERISCSRLTIKFIYEENGTCSAENAEKERKSLKKSCRALIIECYSVQRTMFSGKDCNFRTSVSEHESWKQSFPSNTQKVRGWWEHEFSCWTTAASKWRGDECQWNTCSLFSLCVVDGRTKRTVGWDQRKRRGRREGEKAGRERSEKIANDRFAFRFSKASSFCKDMLKMIRLNIWLYDHAIC